MSKIWWLVALAACGDNLVPPAVDAPPPAFEEAAHGPPPVLVSLGGPILTAPRTQPIFWMNDAEFQGKIEDFGTRLSGSTYWKVTTEEYGVGAITSLPAIVTTDPVPATSDALTTWLAQKLDGTHTAEGWPATIDPQTIYSVFLPAGAVIHDPDGDSCDSYGAYHDEATGAHGESIIYALMPRCDYGNPLIDDLTASYSHELIEAATDPLVETDEAYGDADPDNYVMAYTPAAETGDYCEYLDAAYIRFEGYEVQRTWSNIASLAGKDPCLPAPTTPYVAAVPMFTEQAKLTDFWTGGKITTRAVSVPVNTSKTIDVQLISDVPTDEFTVDATDIAEWYGESPELTFAWDKTTGKNGDVLHLTITRARAGQMPGSELFLQAKVGATIVSQWWGYVAN